MQKFLSSISQLAPRNKRLTVFAAVTLGLLSVIAYASIPDAGGVVHGCYKKSGGSLRVIDDTTATCDNNETPIQWSQSGPQGPQGPQGSQGPQGPAGPAGPGGAKAMVYFDFDGTIKRCYNGFTGSTTGNCGFTISQIQSGIYSVDFGSDISNSFYSLALDGMYFEPDPISLSFVGPYTTATSRLDVVVSAHNVGFTNRPVIVIVF